MRQTAKVVGRLKDTHLPNFFNRIAYRKGRASAISATARKLAVIIWKILHDQPSSIYKYLDQKRKRKVRELQKQIAKLDVKLNDMKPIISIV